MSRKSERAWWIGHRSNQDRAKKHGKRTCAKSEILAWSRAHLLHKKGQKKERGRKETQSLFSPSLTIIQTHFPFYKPECGNAQMIASNEALNLTQTNSSWSSPTLVLALQFFLY